MAESIIQPGTDHSEEPAAATRGNKETGELALPQAEPSVPPTLVIWTPLFIVIFALVLAFGLSIESILTQGWLNLLYHGQWVMQIHVILVCIAWLAITVLARSSWVRTAGIFGCIWAIFMSVDIAIISHTMGTGSPAIAHVNAAICIALLGAYICMSMDRTPFQRWDAWFFGLAPICGTAAVVLGYFLTPVGVRSMTIFEGYVASIALVLSVLVWWGRPSCWKTQPGPAFLFGTVPLILLLLDISSVGLNASNFFLAEVVLSPMRDRDSNEANFFLSQVVLLSMLLGNMRIIQGQLRLREAEAKQTHTPIL